jgi:hypothetical protein
VLGESKSHIDSSAFTTARLCRTRIVVRAELLIRLEIPSNSDTHRDLPVQSRVIERLELLARRPASHDKNNGLGTKLLLGSLF